MAPFGGFGGQKNPVITDEIWHTHVLRDLESRRFDADQINCVTALLDEALQTKDAQDTHVGINEAEIVRAIERAKQYHDIFQLDVNKLEVLEQVLRQHLQ